MGYPVDSCAFLSILLYSREFCSIFFESIPANLGYPCIPVNSKVFPKPYI